MESVRKSTLKFSFSYGSPRPKVYEIDEWLSDKICLQEDDVLGLQYDFISNAVYVKLKDDDCCLKILENTSGRAEFLHATGEISNVDICFAGLGLRTVKLYNVPFEVSNEAVKQVFSLYGNVILVYGEKWSGNMKFKVDNGVRNIRIDINKHIPSYVTIQGFKALVIYDGQPRTCALCNSAEHLRIQCPRYKQPRAAYNVSTAGARNDVTYAGVLSDRLQHKQINDDKSKSSKINNLSMTENTEGSNNSDKFQEVRVNNKPINDTREKDGKLLCVDSTTNNRKSNAANQSKVMQATDLKHTSLELGKETAGNEDNQLEDDSTVIVSVNDGGKEPQNKKMRVERKNAKESAEKNKGKHERTKKILNADEKDRESTSTEMKGCEDEQDSYRAACDLITPGHYNKQITMYDNTEWTKLMDDENMDEKQVNNESVPSLDKMEDEFY